MNRPLMGSYFLARIYRVTDIRFYLIGQLDTDKGILYGLLGRTPNPAFLFVDSAFLFDGLG
jgi:hypothetical protein